MITHYLYHRNYHHIRPLRSGNFCLEIQRNPFVPTMNHVAFGARRRVRCILDFETILYVISIMTLPDSTIPQKLASLKKSKFRSKFKLSQKDRDYIATKGLETIKEHAYQFINSRVAPDFPKNDGKQTPMRGHPVFIAQHATATCCRGCISKWHGIEKGRALNEEEVDFVVALIMGWIERQIDEKGGSAVWRKIIYELLKLGSSF